MTMAYVTEERCEFESLMHRSGVAVGWVTAPPTITVWRVGQDTRF
jgi:hypothetical protein